MRRVLITGSRDWRDQRAVWDALNEQLTEAQMVGEGICVVHGNATGADTWAHDWVIALGDHRRAIVEPYPADWNRHCDENCFHKPRFRDGKRYCPRAGTLRNEQMVALGADVCLAFPVASSKGTWHCMGVAEAAGIPVINMGAVRPHTPNLRSHSSDSS